MKTAFVFTSFSIRADVDDLRTCWRIFVAKRSSVKSFRFGIIATTFSIKSHVAWLNGSTRSRRLHTFHESVCVEIATAFGNMNEQDSEANPIRNTVFGVKGYPLNPT